MVRTIVRLKCVIVVFICSVVIVCLYLLSCGQKQQIKLTVNGYEIEENWLNHIIKRYEATGLSEETARNQALQECIRYKVQQILALEQGLLEDISYKAYQKAWKEENQRRSKAIASGKIVYGPNSFSEDIYYSVYYENVFYKLKHQLFSATTEEKKAYYQKKKETWYLEHYYYELEWKMEDNGVVTERKEVLSDKEKESIFDTDALIARYYAAFLQEGETSGPIEVNQKIYYIHLISKEKPIYTSYEEVQNDKRLIEAIIEYKYQQLVDKMVSTADLRQE